MSLAPTRNHREYSERFRSSDDVLSVIFYLQSRRSLKRVQSSKVDNLFERVEFSSTTGKIFFLEFKMDSSRDGVAEVADRLKRKRKKKVVNNAGIFRNSNFNRLFIKRAIHHCAMHLRFAGAC